MTNEEIIKDIADRHSYIGDDIEYSDLIQALEEMAEWKDQQFKEYLEKKLADLESLKTKTFEDFSDGFDCGKKTAINEIINELFGETEQDNSDRED